MKRWNWVSRMDSCVNFQYRKIYIADSDLNNTFWQILAHFEKVVYSYNRG